MPEGLLVGCHPWDPSRGNLYSYRPSKAAGIAFSVLFGISCLIHLFQGTSKRIWWTHVFTVGALTELIGWAGRTWSYQCPYNLNAFLMQITTLILAPTFFTAGIYVILGRLIQVMGRHTSPISAVMYLWIFCACDILSLVIQAVGGGMASIAVAAVPQRNTKTGTDIMVAGIVFQMASVTVFLGLFVEFLRRCRKTHLSKRIKILILGSAISVAMIYIRSIYRTVELLQGWRGYLITREGFFIGLDGILMLISVGVFNIIHPGWFLVQDQAPEPETLSTEEPEETKTDHEDA